MTDNAMVYRRAHAFAAVLDANDARHILTPRWNGKAERFIQTLQREWAYAHRWQSSAEHLRSLPSFLRYYNRRRPHTHWETGRRSAAFTTSVGRTTREPRRWLVP
jgi:transposase InsO family protein